MASTNNTQKKAAKSFVQEWSGKGYEKGSDFIDAAVLEAYGFPKDATESDIVARLFKMYQELTQK